MDQFADRKNIIVIMVLVVAFFLIVRLFYIQVIDSSYKLSAENNSKRIETIYAARGLIYDRNKKLLVYNQPAYDLMIAPFELKPFDSTALCELLDIDIDTAAKRHRPGKDPEIPAGTFHQAAVTGNLCQAAGKAV